MCGSIEVDQNKKKKLSSLSPKHSDLSLSPEHSGPSYYDTWENTVSIQWLWKKKGCRDECLGPMEENPWHYAERWQYR